ncbi:MAG: Ig-like domain-containing protein [Deltaproteobacteria bacterium]|nr:Ig-like domain-containing protein [Deltaproteobacteria bacterium]
MRSSLPANRDPLLKVFAATLAVGSVFSCAREITTEDAIEPADFVEAQFDPTNPIPVLQLVPSPTALAEKPEGGLKVTPAPCELPSTKQCAGLATGWGVTTPVTLYFSGEVDVDTANAGIKFLKLTAGAPEAVAFTAERRDRIAPPAACKEGENGSNPPRTYTDAQIPPGIQLILRPNAPLDPESTYVVLVESGLGDDGTVSGLKTAAGEAVQPAALFALLNVAATERPVTEDGEIPNALLRNNVQALVIDALFPGKTISELTADEKQQVGLAVKERAATGLAPLYGYFNAFIDPLVTAGATAREKLVFATLWHTAPVPTEIEFDPLAGKLPFPNVQLMTTPTVSVTPAGTRPDVKVTLPINPCTTTGQTGCDSPSAVGLKMGLNTLNGFSTTSPMSVTLTRDVDAASLEGKVVMYEVADSGSAVGSPVPIMVETSSKSDVAQATIRITPVNPLKQNTNYVVAVLKGILDANGKPVMPGTTYSLLKSDDAFIDDSGAFNSSAVVNLGGTDIPVGAVLQCSTVPITGELATDEQLLGTATDIERKLMHARWLEAFRALEGSPAIARADVLMAWSYKTQDITGALDVAKGAIPQWDALRGQRAQAGMAPPRLFDTGTVIEGTVNIATLMGIPQRFCLPLCQGGLFPGIPPASCSVAAVSGHPLCTAAMNLFASRIGQVRFYGMTSYRLRRGNFANTNPAMPIGAFDPARFRDPKYEVIPVMVAIPAGSSTVAEAATPVVIFQHGLGQYKEQMLAVANSFAARGFATVAIDAPDHGARTGDILQIVNGQPAPCPEIDPESVTCPLTFDPANPQACTGGCDGSRDPSGTGFLSLNVFASRDNFRQFTVDQLTLLNTLRTESQAGGVLQFLGADQKVGYAGQSLGGISGANFAAYAPEASGVVVNVGGGSLARMGFALPGRFSVPLFYGPLVQAGICTPKDPANLAAGCVDNPAFRQFMVSAQWVLDPGDPLANTIAITDSHNGIPALGADKVLIQMVKPDGVVANFTTLALGRALGFDPDDNSATSHFQTYDFTSTGAVDCHGFLLDPSCTLPDLETGLCYSLGAQEQAARFIDNGSIGGRVKTDLFIPNPAGGAPIIDCGSL